ncbi:MAG: yrrB 8 [Planctomycetaceae bacterium]|nr:yrrB 8 [Planctomycetaceae bacterium]
MQRRNQKSTWCLTLLAAALTMAWAAEIVRANDKSLVGKNVYPRSPSILVKRGTETIATGAGLSFPVVVRQQAEDFVTIWVNKSKQEGQVLRQDILTASEAIPVFTPQFVKNPKDLYTAFMLSLAWEDTGNLDQAIGIVSQALESQPHAVFYNRRGNLWQRKRAYWQAIQDYNASLRLDPTSTSCLFNRGLAYSHQGTNDLAIADFNAVLKASPLNASAFVARGACWKSKGVEDRALSDFTMAIILNPDEPLAYQERAHLWYKKGQNIKALADYTEALRLQHKSNNSTTYLNRGLVWVKLGLYGLALSDFDHAIRSDSRNATAYNNRGWIRATCPDKSYRNGKLALADARLACELADWNSPHHLSTLGEASAEVGDFASAIHWQNRASQLQQKLQPGDAEFETGSKARLDCYKAGKPFREARPTEMIGKLTP